VVCNVHFSLAFFASVENENAPKSPTILYRRPLAAIEEKPAFYSIFSRENK
jgi:hypothetical protein